MTRSSNILIRVSPAEKLLIQERAQASGMKVSDYLRSQAGITKQAARAAEETRTRRRAEKEAPGDRAAIEQRLRREQPGLPERGYRMLAARELARRR